MAKRIDLAAPSVIDPAAFTFVAGTYFGGGTSEDFDALLGEWMAEKSATGAPWYSSKREVMKDFPTINAAGNFARKGTCDHCGAHFEWGAVYVHTDGAHIVVGNICANRTMDVPTRHELDVKRLKSRLATHRETVRKAASAREQATAHGFEWLYTGALDNRILADIARKGFAYGSLTERQIELVKRIHSGTPAEWEVKRAAREAQRKLDEETAEPVPQIDARIDLEGTVLSLKDQEGFRGMMVTKMLVRHVKGYKLWGTMPTGLTAKIGDKVAFTARVERSEKDAKFGFFSRPSKARVLAA